MDILYEPTLRSDKVTKEIHEKFELLDQCYKLGILNDDEVREYHTLKRAIHNIIPHVWNLGPLGAQEIVGKLANWMVRNDHGR